MASSALRLRRVALGAAAAMLAAAPAAAELGGARRSVDLDRVHLSATMTSATAASHVVHSLTLADGGVVREFADADGTVFAVAWAGPGHPDLRQLLGVSFGTFQNDLASARRRPRQAMVIRRDDLVVAAAGHPGAFRGFAYLPRRLPPGFAADALE